MDKTELLIMLEECAVLSDQYDEEIAHQDADDALLAYINDAEITEAFKAIRKWYC